jgi:hypothetical protein
MVTIVTRAVTKFREVGLWNLIAWGEAVAVTIDGATYFVKGNSAALGPSFDVLKQVPGGLHTYGAVMLVVAALIMYSSARRGSMAEHVQFALFILGFLISASIITSWVQADSYQTNAISKWFILTWSGLVLTLTAGKNRRVTPDKE